MRADLVLIRGGGDLATGVARKLFLCGYGVLITETPRPTAIRRLAAFSTAVHAGEAAVEGVSARLAGGIPEALALLEKHEKIPVLTDPDCLAARALCPAAVIDAIIAKRNTGTRLDMAPATVALGPGFTAGVDVRAVVETNRGHDLGRVLWEGAPEPNTGVPGMVGGYGKERVIHAPVGGELRIMRDIGSIVEAGELIAGIGGTPVFAPIPGVVRGMLPEGFEVWKGLKMADIDPRLEQLKNCATISDKARCIAGGVLEALLCMGVLPRFAPETRSAQAEAPGGGRAGI